MQGSSEHPSRAQHVNDGPQPAGGRGTVRRPTEPPRHQARRGRQPPHHGEQRKYFYVAVKYLYFIVS